MTLHDIQQWEASHRNECIAFIKLKRKCGFGARYNGATVRDEVVLNGVRV